MGIENSNEITPNKPNEINLYGFTPDDLEARLVEEVSAGKEPLVFIETDNLSPIAAQLIHNSSIMSQMSPTPTLVDTYIASQIAFTDQEISFSAKDRRDYPGHVENLTALAYETRSRLSTGVDIINPETGEVTQYDKKPDYADSIKAVEKLRKGLARNSRLGTTIANTKRRLETSRHYEALGYDAHYYALSLLNAVDNASQTTGKKFEVLPFYYEDTIGLAEERLMRSASLTAAVNILSQRPRGIEDSTVHSEYISALRGLAIEMQYRVANIHLQLAPFRGKQNVISVISREVGNLYSVSQDSLGNQVGGESGSMTPYAVPWIETALKLAKRINFHTTSTITDNDIMNAVGKRDLQISILKSAFFSRVARYVDPNADEIKRLAFTNEVFADDYDTANILGNALLGNLFGGTGKLSHWKSRYEAFSKDWKIG